MDGPLDYHTNWTTFISGRKRFHLYVESKKMIQIYLQNRNKTQILKTSYGYQSAKVEGR